MKLRLTRRALDDLAGISAAIKAQNPAAALRVADELERAFLLLSAHPHAGRAIAGGRRRFSLQRFPYLIFYRLNAAASVVDVLTVRHGARAPEG